MTDTLNTIIYTNTLMFLYRGCGRYRPNS